MSNKNSSDSRDNAKLEKMLMQDSKTFFAIAAVGAVGRTTTEIVKHAEGDTPPPAAVGSIETALCWMATFGLIAGILTYAGARRYRSLAQKDASPGAPRP